jgi:hypothetical protein
MGGVEWKSVDENHDLRIEIAPVLAFCKIGP